MFPPLRHGGFSGRSPPRAYIPPTTFILHSTTDTTDPSLRHGRAKYVLTSIEMSVGLLVFPPLRHGRAGYCGNYYTRKTVGASYAVVTYHVGSNRLMARTVLTSIGT
jgi:hypothetical protein